VPLLHAPPLCTLRELQDGTYTIADLRDMHDAIAVKHEIEARHQEAAEARAQDG